MGTLDSKFRARSAVDGQDLIVMRSITERLTGVETNPSTDPRKWVLLPDDIPSLFVFSFGYQSDEHRNIDPRWTGGITRWRFVLVFGPDIPPRPRPVPAHIARRNGE
jgi:hypothetical protein